MAENVNQRVAARLDELDRNIIELYSMEDDPDLRERTVATSLGVIHEALTDIVRLIEAYRDAS